MKQLKLCLTAAATALSLAAFAQTESDPAVIVAGENSYDGNDHYTYWSYTPAQDEIVTITGIYANGVTVEGKTVASYSNQNQYAGDLCTVFAAEAGKTVLMEVYRGWYDPSEYTFTASFEPCEYNDGQDCSDPVKMTKPDTFIPTIGTPGGWGTPAVYKQIYLQYTADVDGMLDMKFSSIPDSFAWAEMAESPCDSQFVNYPEDDLDTVMYLEIENGKTYIFRVEETDAMFATFQSRVSVPGASCEDAWTASLGLNEIPAEAGTYWYKVNVAKAGYLTISSEAEGSISLNSKCNSSYPSVCDAIALRIKVDSNSSRVFSITKEATASPVYFNIDVEDAQPYDKMATAEEINAGETYNTPGFGGDYYYMVTAPAEGAYFLNLTIHSENPNINCAIYEYDQQWESWQNKTSGFKTARCEAIQGGRYIVKLTMPNSARNVPFDVTFTEVEPGQTAANPLEAVVGENGLPAQPATFFAFTPAESAWMALSVPESYNIPSVYLKADKYTSPTSDTATPAEGYGAARRWQLVAGVEYMIQFGEMTEAASFFLEMMEFQAGEAAGSAIAIVDGMVELPAAAGTTWYRFTASQDGFATVATDLPYSLDGVYSTVMTYINDETGSNGMGLNSSWVNGHYELGSRKFNVIAGDVLYIKVQKPEVEGCTLTVTESVALPGETPANAIRVELIDGTATIEAPVVDYNGDPVYYIVHLEEGIFTLSNSASCSMYMYTSIENVNSNDYMAYSSGYSDEDGNYIYGFKRVSVATAGDYYFKLSNNGSYYDPSPTTMTFTMREPGPGESSATAIPIEVTEPGTADWSVNAMEYGDSCWYSIYLKPGDISGSTDYNFSAKMYAASDLSTPVATFSYDYTVGEYLLDAEIAEEGTYYFYVTTNYYFTLITLTGTAIDVNTAVGALSAASFVKGGKGEIAVNGNGMMNVYDLNGRTVASADVNGHATVSVAPGMYVVRFGDKSAKVLVK